MAQPKFRELFDAAGFDRDRDGTMTARRQFRVFGVSEIAALGTLASGDPDNGLAPVGVQPKVSTHPRLGMLLDSYSFDPAVPDTIVTLRYRNTNTTGGDIDPLDEAFGGTWSMGFREAERAVPTITVKEAAVSFGTEATPAAESKQYWDLGPTIDVKMTEPIFNWTNNSTTIGAGSVTVSLAAAAYIFGQAGKLHALPLGGLWKFEPRSVREAVKGKYLIDYSWSQEQDIPLLNGDGEPLTEFAQVAAPAAVPNAGRWVIPLGSSGTALPAFGPAEAPLLRPAYASIVVAPNRNIEPSLSNPPELYWVRSRALGGANGSGWQALPGLIV